MRGRLRSSANRSAPVTLPTASTWRWALPTTRNSLAPAIHRFLRWLGLLAPHPRGRELDGLVDLDVTGASAEVARQHVLDLIAAGTRIRRDERLGDEQDGGRAVPALGRAQVGERLLQRMEPGSLGHPLDGLHRFAGAGQAQDEAREDGDAIHEHGTGAALAELTAVLGPGEPQVLPEDFQERLVGGERDLCRFAVDGEGDLRVQLGHPLIYGYSTFCHIPLGDCAYSRDWRGGPPNPVRVSSPQVFRRRHAAQNALSLHQTVHCR